MVNSSINIRVVLLPVLALLAKEILWNISVFFVSPLILNIPFQLVLILIYLSTGFIADSLFGYETAEAAMYGAVTGVIGSVLGGVIIAPIFFGMFFYAPGIPVFTALYNIVINGVQGGILGFIGSLLTSFDQLGFISDKFETINDGLWNSINEIRGREIDTKPPQATETSSEYPVTRDPKGIATHNPMKSSQKITNRELSLLENIGNVSEDSLPGLTREETREILESTSDDDLSQHPEITEEDKRTLQPRDNSDLLPGLTEDETRIVLESTSDDNLGLHPELTKEEIRKIVEERHRAQSESYESEIMVEKSVKPSVSSDTQGALMEVMKESEKAKSSGIINGIKRIFQKLAE